MSKSAKTKDELFMVRLFEQASQSGDMSTAFDRYQIGILSGLQHRAVDAICTLLGQANFIKKVNKTEIFITPNGIRLVEQILEK